jgi:hypothetical protein
LDWISGREEVEEICTIAIAGAAEISPCYRVAERKDAEGYAVGEDGRSCRSGWLGECWIGILVG